MEESVKNLLDQGIISEKDAAIAIAKASDEGFGGDEDAETETSETSRPPEPARSKPKEKSPTFETDDVATGNSDDNVGYSF
jgi:hypothetical protein